MTLGEILMNFRYRDEVLRRLKTATDQELLELERAHQDRPLSAIAWSARNLLEILIWVQYCQVSEENAKTFSDDAWRDTLDLVKFKAPTTLSTNTSANAYEIYKSMVGVLKNAGFEGIEERYTQVSNAAKSLNLEEFFGGMNKILSKFAHPTALSLTLPSEGSTLDLRSSFYGAGDSFGTSILALIAAYERQRHNGETIDKPIQENF